ncbi:Hypothetical predicted protein [Cloeon dipterum]|uniref:DUF4773 domain-containing protein n=1 Tax=Cloeon dipterum TaxID=197152 RepID=A0A8S1DK79_9INSE|nr:Hypothetical predicted protein [Cloeon dipterum]
MRPSTIFIGFVLLAGSMILACDPDKKNCWCGEYSYGCCETITILVFWDYEVCARIEYSYDDEAMDISITVDDKNIFEDTLSVDRLDGEERCTYYKGFKMCLNFSELELKGRSMHLCIDVDVMRGRSNVYDKNFCFTVGNKESAPLALN